MSSTRGSGVLPRADDVLEMSGMRGVGGVCEMCVFDSSGVGVGVLGFTNPVGTWDLCLGCGDVGGDVGVCPGPVPFMFVCVVSLDYSCRWQVQVSVYCARIIHTHPRYTQCRILLHLIDICFLPCICR